MGRRLDLDKATRLIALATITAFVLYGALITFFPLLPFWIDEWLLLDNLKFKTAAQLWHKLDHTQQFPRLYLELIKGFSAANDYSYTSLRLPSFLTHVAGLLLLYYLSGRIFQRDNLSRFLWVMVYVSFNTSIHYFVQVKQYTMEMALSLVGIWQVLALAGDEDISRRRFLSLCLSFAVCPFFSYTYPIVAAPVYMLALITNSGQTRPMRKWLPLLLGSVSIAGVYCLDIRHVLADGGMQDFWNGLLLKTFSWKHFFANSYAMFCNIGSGDLFGNIFGVFGVAAFLYGNYSLIRRIQLSPAQRLIIQYSCLLLWIMFGLYAAGKLPLGTWRLNSFAVPAIGFLIVIMLQHVSPYAKLRLPLKTISLILFLALVANVFTTMAELAGPEHAKKLSIYRATGRAIKEAQRLQLPILVTSGIAYPFEDRWPGDWILKTHPAYTTDRHLNVFALPAVDSANVWLQRIQPQWKQAIVLDGDHLSIIHR